MLVWRMRRPPRPTPCPSPTLFRSLLDAASLGTALERSASVEDALALHLKQRRLHIWFYQTMSFVMTPFYQSDSRILPVVRDIAIAPTTQLPLMRQLISRLVTGEFLDPVKRIGL